MVFENAINRLVFVGRALLAFLLLMPALARAQGGYQVDISQNATIYAHDNSNLNIFSNVFHSGTFVSSGKAEINFFGSEWENGASSRLLDESTNGFSGLGGLFTFSGRFINATQTIRSVASQPYRGFPNLRIDNPQNVSAVSRNLYVNSTLDFINGSLILTGVDLSVGRNGGGQITGFSENRFIVTGSGAGGGSLVQSFTGASDDPTYYPVGSSLDSYTPASLIYKGIPQNIKIRITNEGYDQANFPKYVHKTWLLVRDFADASGRLELTLQHNRADEGIEYSDKPTETYIRRYDESLGLYDVVGPHPTTTPGTITTVSGGVPGSYINTRLNIGALRPMEYFTKSVIAGEVAENTSTYLPNAISPNHDGFNDTYIFVKRLPTDKVRFEVYSSSQVLVYQNMDYDNSFDGTGNQRGFLGNVLPDGIYYYLISVNGAKGIRGYLLINR